MFYANGVIQACIKINNQQCIKGIFLRRKFPFSFALFVLIHSDKHYLTSALKYYKYFSQFSR